VRKNPNHDGRTVLNTYAKTPRCEMTRRPKDLEKRTLTHIHQRTHDIVTYGARFHHDNEKKALV
jgi:hypothetical protein